MLQRRLTQTSGTIEKFFDLTSNSAREQPEICNAHYLYSQCLGPTDEERMRAAASRQKAVEVYNCIRTDAPRNYDTLAATDIAGLTPYDYL